MEATTHDAALLLPEGTRLLHIGPPKTGTTTVQAAFHAAGPELASQGVFYAGRTRHPRRAVFAVTGRPWVGGKVPPMTEWTGLVDDVRAAAQPRAVISSEAFAQADGPQIRRIVDDLDPGRVHVVLTLRPLVRILPSSWQQSVQTGSDTRYADWLATQLESNTAGGPRSFWYRHRHDRLIGRWAEVVGPERVTAIVLDDSDRSHVLRRFEGLTGLREGTLEERPDLTNRSLTAPEAEAVRAFNAAFRTAGLGARLHNRVINLGASTRMKLRVPPPDWSRIETPPWAMERADAIAHEIVAGIAASGVRVVGDLDALKGLAVAAPAPATAADPGPGDDRVPSEIAAELALGVLLAGGATPELARPGVSVHASGKADGRRAAGRDPQTGRRTYDLTGVPTRVLARALVRRARAAAARHVRPPKGKTR
jgi:hypothetical protein